MRRLGLAFALLSFALLACAPREAPPPVAVACASDADCVTVCGGKGGRGPCVLRSQQPARPPSHCMTKACEPCIRCACEAGACVSRPAGNPGEDCC